MVSTLTPRLDLSTSRAGSQPCCSHWLVPGTMSCCGCSSLTRPRRTRSSFRITSPTSAEASNIFSPATRPPVRTTGQVRSRGSRPRRSRSTESREGSVNSRYLPTPSLHRTTSVRPLWCTLWSRWCSQFVEVLRSGFHRVDDQLDPVIEDHHD